MDTLDQWFKKLPSAYEVLPDKYKSNIDLEPYMNKLIRALYQIDVGRDSVELVNSEFVDNVFKFKFKFVYKGPTIYLKGE